MAGFDPDAYLAKRPAAAPQAFDPDAYLAAVAAPSSGIPGPRATGTIVDQIPGYGGPVPAADNAPSLTTGQKIYRIARPVLAPTAEALGTAGGAALGTFLGPAGTVGGAGLGYGMTKEALEMADVAMGMKAPRQGAAQVAEPVRNVLEGATFEAGGRVAGQALGYLGGKIADLRQIPNQKAAKIVRDALGPDLDQVTNALRAAQGKGVSAAQATADINSPTFQALIERATARDPRFTRALTALQEKGSINALSDLAGGATAAEVRGTTEAAKNALTQTTTPMREAALNRANLGKAVADYEAQAGKLSADAAAKVADVRRLVEAGDLAEAAGRLELIKKGVPVGFTPYTYKGELAKMADDWAAKAADASLDLGQGARFAQGASDALRSVGIKPLESGKIVGSIRNVANNPEFAGNDVLLGAVKNVADDVAKWTGSGGVIDAKALDAIRKNSVNAAIQQLRPGMDATSQRNLAASVMNDIKPALINAIEDAGGTGYRQYLADYTKGMQAISQKKLTGEALKLWKTNKDEFVRLVQNESPETVEKILGSGKYNIATELADTTMATLQDQAKKRLTELAIKGQASAGQDALKELLLDNLSKVRLPSYITAVAATTNKALSILENKIGKKTMDILTEGLKTPEGAAKLLETLPGSERVRVLKLLSDPKSWAQKSAGAAAVGVTNALAPEPEPTRIQLNNMMPGRP
jgi:hypothetical protein